jgi:hypothetical protein
LPKVRDIRAHGAFRQAAIGTRTTLDILQAADARPILPASGIREIHAAFADLPLMSWNLASMRR